MKARKTQTTSSARKRRKPKRAAPPPQVEGLDEATLDQIEREASAGPAPSPADPRAAYHVQAGLLYARGVVDGTIPACEYVKQACRRQLNDLERFKNHPIYHFDAALADRVCRFIERIPHVKGPKAKDGELILLEGWQAFVLTTVFGWRRKDTGGRRFRRVYIEVPRGNAKSTLSSGVGLYCLTSDGEEGAEVYSAATTRDQARITWGDAQAMMRKRADFATKLGVVVNQFILLHPRTNSKYEPLSRDSSTMDGKNVHCAIIDELHAHKDRGVYDVIETATAKRYNSLIWIITTAGTDTSGICYEIRSYCVKLLAGVVEDDSQFAIIYTVDDGDDWTDPLVWRKANPNWGVSVMPDVFGQLAAKAMQVVSAQNTFKTKHLNIWCNADVAWMDMRAWDRCVDPNLKLDDFVDDACFLGVDLATRTDIACVAKLFIRNVDQPQVEGRVAPASERHYYLFLDSFLPESAIQDGRNSQYQGWAQEGWLTETPGDVLDFGVIREAILTDWQRFHGREVPYDPWQATQLAQELQDQHGVVMVEFRPTVMNFSAPMKELEALVLSGRLHVQADPVLRWMVSNVVCHLDAKDNIYPRKERPEQKIDGVVAAIMALGRAMLMDEPYLDRGLRSL